MAKRIKQNYTGVFFNIGKTHDFELFLTAICRGVSLELASPYNCEFGLAFASRRVQTQFPAFFMHAQCRRNTGPFVSDVSFC
jgi:hypothetical protein